MQHGIFGPASDLKVPDHFWEQFQPKPARDPNTITLQANPRPLREPGMVTLQAVAPPVEVPATCDSTTKLIQTLLEIIRRDSSAVIIIL